jgi:DNA-binding LacI/PurR family transcriptional regulator
VQQALEQLESEGWIVRRQGSGTYVNVSRPFALDQTVVLCMDGKGHVFGEFTSLLSQALSRMGKVPLLIDTSNMEESAKQLKQTLASPVPVFIINGVGRFPFEILKGRAAAGKRIFGSVTWESEDVFPESCVLTDFTEGGRMVARFLASCGCRRPLVVGPPDMIELLDAKPGYPCRQYGFADECRALGIRFNRLGIGTDCPNYPYNAVVDTGRLDNFLKGPQRIDAIYGLRDVDAWIAQNLIAERKAGFLEKITVIGFGDTPWSQAANPRLSTVAFNLQKICDELIRELSAPPSAVTGKSARLVLVPPVMIERV